MTFRYRWRRFYGAAVCRERKRPIGAGAVAVFTSQCAAFVFCFVVFWRMRRIEGRWAQRNRVPKISNNKGRADARVLQWPRSPHCNWNNNPSSTTTPSHTNRLSMPSFAAQWHRGASSLRWLRFPLCIDWLPNCLSVRNDVLPIFQDGQALLSSAAFLLDQSKCDVYKFICLVQRFNSFHIA